MATSGNMDHCSFCFQKCNDPSKMKHFCYEEEVEMSHLLCEDCTMLAGNICPISMSTLIKKSKLKKKMFCFDILGAPGVF